MKRKILKTEFWVVTNDAFKIWDHLNKNLTLLAETVEYADCISVEQ